MFETIRIRLTALALSSLALSASAQTQPPAAAGAGAPAAIRAPQAAADPVLATVNGEPIQQSEIANLLDQFMIPPGSEERAYQNAVELLVNTKLLAQFLQERKITVAEPEIQEIIAQYEENFKAQGADLPTALAESGTSMQQFRDRIARSLQWKKFVEAQATDAELSKYVEQNKDVFSGTLVRASHILIAVEPDASDEEKQQAREKLQAVKQQIDSGQINFADAANKFSEDPGNQAKPSGGDLNFFPRKGQFIEPFADAAFSMESGQISDPIETEYGYHLIQVTDRREGKPVDFDQLKPQIMEQYASDLQERIVDNRRGTAEIKIAPMPPGLVQTEVPVEPEAPATAPAPAPGAAPAPLPAAPPAGGR